MDLSASERSCPLCAEPLSEEAARCPYCRAGLGETPLGGAHRDRPGRQVAGVSVALAAATGVSVTLVRLAFILLTFATGVAPVVYVALWLVLPNEPGGLSAVGRWTRGITEERRGDPAPLERFVGWMRPKLSQAGRWLRGEPRPTEGSP